MIGAHFSIQGVLHHPVLVTHTSLFSTILPYHTLFISILSVLTQYRVKDIHMYIYIWLV
ncbi:hypothetical protein RchiOBHm_Chr5g0073871 [Rosa chinensis]|uniref:Uncharacterized protein n=1 Tax=Rosa chinensis TaxID=74649 RepID=A0A2P6QL22_ROSCH|nr:hypothetical protein RchiOBHm_Chr5g0073871 [Rosa chinensis]